MSTRDAVPIDHLKSRQPLEIINKELSRYLWVIVGEKAFSWTQNPPPAMLCEFDSRSEHQEISKDLADS